MVALKGDKEIGDRINKIIARLAEANDLQKRHRPGRLQRRGQAGQGQGDAGSAVQAGRDLRRPGFPREPAEGDDLLGDAYEYLMRHFATESGKSKGQFYTPAEVSRILAKVVGINGQTRQDQTVYDPTCGSGSLLLKAADEAPRGMTIYGQEKDNATWALRKMNMILHGNPTAEIWQGRHASPLPIHERRRQPEDVRLRCGQSAVLDQVVDQRLTGETSSAASSMAYRPSQERRLRLPAARPQVAEEHGQGARSSCRTACCSEATPKPTSAAT